MELDVGVEDDVPPEYQRPAVGGQLDELQRVLQALEWSQLQRRIGPCGGDGHMRLRAT